MPGESRFPNKSGGDACDFETANTAIARKDGLALIDDLIGIFYERLLKSIEKNSKPGDLIKMIELRYKLSPTNAEQTKFWAILSKIRRDVHKNSAVPDKLKKNGDNQKSAIGRSPLKGGIK